MTKILFLFLLTFQIQAFETCIDAKNFGENTGVFFTSAVMNRLNCDAEKLPNAIDMLAENAKITVLNTSDSAEIKKCFHNGHFNSIISTLKKEYAECPQGPPFSCLNLKTVAKIGANAFIGIYKSIPTLNSIQIVDIFGNANRAVCSEPNRERCKEIIDETLAEEPSVILPQQGLIATLKRSICD